jgi:hypothetical protein
MSKAVVVDAEGDTRYDVPGGADVRLPLLTARCDKKLIRATQILAVMFCLSLTAPLTRNQEFDRRDGNWWKGINRVNKAYYVAGFVDGIALGNRLSLAGIDKNDNAYKEVSERVATTFSNGRAKYLANVTQIQLTDRLDAFYEDSANRRILAHDAVWLVLNQIAGTPEAEMQAMMESYRKSAAGE